MINIKSLVVAALVSGIAAASFAQAPAAEKVAGVSTPTTTSVTAPAPAKAASMTKTAKVKKHMGMKHKKIAKTKKADAAMPATSSAN